MRNRAVVQPERAVVERGLSLPPPPAVAATDEHFDGADHDDDAGCDDDLDADRKSVV